MDTGPAPHGPAPHGPQRARRPLRPLRVPRALRLLNDLLAFVLEVAALLALAVWGYEWGGRLVVGALIGAVVAGAAAVLWGAFAAPRARYRVPLPAVLGVKALVFGSAALAVAGLGHGQRAWWFAGLVLVNTALATAYRSRERST
ncbi:YrdB family protein [Streptomyces sp. NPDC048507]|uniref:YrdB family protein n=1 Tax=Streptomyces sp. NPDC048507 TaxID=3365560 RepID=UPI0037180A46